MFSRSFTDEDIAKIQETVQSWKTGEGYEDVAGFCKSETRLEEIGNEMGFVLTPGRYVGVAYDDEETADIPSLVQKMSGLTKQSRELDSVIERSLSRIGLNND